MTEMTGFLLEAVSFLAGFALGVINYRLFLRSIGGIVAKGESAGIHKQVMTAGFFRYLFIFPAGICLIRGASLPPFPLCGGILLATYMCRYYTWRSQR